MYSQPPPSLSPPTYDDATRDREYPRQLERDLKRMSSSSSLGANSSYHRRESNKPSRRLPPPPRSTPSPSPSTSSLSPSLSSSTTTTTSSSSSVSAVPDSVQVLLLSTQELKYALEKWSVGLNSEADVSDSYVEFGNAFNRMVYAFSAAGVDLRPLHSIPIDLRTALERLLAEDDEPSPCLLEHHMPAIRSVLVSMFKGLKERERLWKALETRRRRI